MSLQVKAFDVGAHVAWYAEALGAAGVLLHGSLFGNRSAVGVLSSGEFACWSVLEMFELEIGEAVLEMFELEIGEAVLEIGEAVLEMFELEIGEAVLEIGEADRLAVFEFADAS
jgi:hypothetical protein